MSRAQHFLDLVTDHVTRYHEDYESFAEIPTMLKIDPKIADLLVVNRFWDVIIVRSPDQKFKTTSYLNFKPTAGGAHVDKVVDAITTRLITLLCKDMSEIQQHLWIFINLNDENTEIDMTDNRVKTCSLSYFPNFGMMQQLVAVWPVWSALGKLPTIESRFKDADNCTDSTKSKDCVLWLMEGISGKSTLEHHLKTLENFASSHGILALEGKIMNMAKNSPQVWATNDNIMNLINVLGLHKKMKRYGTLVLAFDSDVYGTIFKQNVIDMLKICHQDNLKQIKIENFILPKVVLVKMGEKVETIERKFFSAKESEGVLKRLKQKNPENFCIRDGLKGLCSHPDVYLRNYILNQRKHRVLLKFDSDFNTSFASSSEDEHDHPILYPSTGISSISMKAFYLYDYLPAKKEVENSQLISIGSGLNRSQQLIVYTALRCLPEKDSNISITAFCGDVTTQTGYSSRQSNLESPVRLLAREYPGSNNLPLLKIQTSPEQKGKAVNSPYYATVAISPICKYVFPTKDLPHLRKTFTHQHNLLINIDHVSVIPLFLVNSSRGAFISGISANKPSLTYKIEDIIDNIHRLQKKESPREMIPFFKGFSGTVYLDNDNEEVFTVGTLSGSPNPNELCISELPLGETKESYKLFLERLNREGKITNFEDNCSGFTTKFDVTFPAETFNRYLESHDPEGGFFTFLKLVKCYHQKTELVALDINGERKKYANIMEMFQEFVDIRIQLYRKRENITSEEEAIAEWNKELQEFTMELQKIQEQEAYDLSEKLKSLPEIKRVSRDNIPFEFSIP
ncbi:hypothetical protein DMENIID0001_140290 [Sergentomyia squamirostris]